MADGPIRSGINTRETTFRSDAERIANAAPTIQQLAMGTGAGEAFNPGDIPSVGYLANLKAQSTTASKNRQSYAGQTISGIKPFINAYRQYLQWRYPSRYGGGSGSSALSTGGQYDPYAGLSMPAISGVPKP